MSVRILVTGSNLFFAARLIHDLGRRGVLVTAADSSTFSAGRSSRYVSRQLKVPPVSTDPGGFLQAIREELDQRSYDLLLPTFEESLLLAEYQEELQQQTRLFLPQFTTMYRLHHKPSLHAFCVAHNLPTPPIRTVCHPKMLSEAAHELGFPVVLKIPAGNNSVGRAFCHDEKELRSSYSHLAEMPGISELPFIQKKIDGNLICTLCYCSNGRKLAEVVYRTCRMFPQAGGTAVHRQSIVHPEISHIADQIVTATRWSGFVGFDFLVDNETGIPYVIDANPRANPAIHLGFMAGLDWSKIILDLIDGRQPDVQTAHAGINAHNLLLDVCWLMEGVLPRAGGIRRFPRRLAQFLSPEWTVHSRGDLLGLGEFKSVAALAVNAVHAGFKSIMTGRQPGQLLLEHANYDPVSAAEFRLQHLATEQQRAA